MNTHCTSKKTSILLSPQAWLNGKVLFFYNKGNSPLPHPPPPPLQFCLGTFFWLKRSTYALRVSIIYSSQRASQNLLFAAPEYWLWFNSLLETIFVKCINLSEENSLGKPCTCQWGLTKNANVNIPLQYIPISLIVFLVSNFSSCNIGTCNSPLLTLSM